MDKDTLEALAVIIRKIEHSGDRFLTAARVGKLCKGKCDSFTWFAWDRMCGYHPDILKGAAV